ncbi:MAG: recombinase family protein, partial [Actinomycetota bacterium]|nr:recombinase family protein [Actinomycetota bacterium]
MTGNGRPLAPYLRQSRAKELTISIEEQRRDIQRWAAANGVDLAPEIVEQNVSGSKSWRERALGDAVDACERGEISGIIVAWQDRLSRENGRATAEVWEALEHAGARLVCAAEGLDTATGDHEMLFAIKAAIAREQWKRYRANWERSQRSAT